MPQIKRWHLAVATSIPIVIVLISTGLVLSRKKSAQQIVNQPEETSVVDKEDSALPDGRPRIGVTRPKFDAMAKLLDKRGEGYKYRNIDESKIVDPEFRDSFDAIFLTCANPKAGGSDKELSQAIREFVSKGGTLYASDLRYDTVAAAFPEVVDRASVAQGSKQEIKASVVFPELQERVGPEILLHFNQEGWRPSAFRGDDVTVFLKGKIRTTANVSIDAPLLVKFPFGRGTVVFTSFHQDEKNTPAELKLLNYLVLKTVVAKLEFREVDAMAGDGLSPRSTTAVGLGSDSPPMVRTFDNPKAGRIQFRLGLSAPGARMRLEVVPPKGQTKVKDGDSTVAIDIPDAAPGRWKYSVYPDKVPYRAFPVVVSVGTPESSDDSRNNRANPTLVANDGNVSFVEVSLGNKQASSSLTPQIAVSDPANYDDMGSLLGKLGKGFQYEKVTMDDLLQPDALDRFDIFFLTCNGWPGEWGMDDDRKATQRQGIFQGRVDPAKMKKSAETIRRFVERGGTLYASDLRIDVVTTAFPRRKAPPRASDRVLPKMKEIRLNVAVIPAVMKMERKWLDIVSPSGHVPTVYETLEKADLSPPLKAKLDQLVAASELSVLVKGDLNEPQSKPNEIVRDLLSRFKLPFNDSDVTTIAKVMCDWESKIHNSIRSRASTKTKALMAQADAEMKRQRNRIILREERSDDQIVEAIVEDSGLREVLGVPRLSLAFNAPEWEPARFLGDVTVLLRGDYRTVLNTKFETPLLVKFREGQGTVIFTSFHNEAQNSEQEEALLRYLVFTAVTAKEVSNADDTMLKGGFSPVKKNQINHMAGNASITRNYNHKASTPLRFALIFSGKEVRLRLTLVAPGGQKYTKEVDSTLIVETSGAAPGEWSYTVEAVKVPYENFPFSVSIGSGNSPTR